MRTLKELLEQHPNHTGAEIMDIYEKENSIEEKEDEANFNKVIEEINTIIKEYGKFGVWDIEADHCPYVNGMGNLTGLMEQFREDGGTVEVYDPTSFSSDSIDSYDEEYTNLDFSQVEYILELAKVWKEIKEMEALEK